ncbi:retrotransposon gag protein [Cucumis melo var. makuwa]|uniref:Retrotransposon gag protein n=1 Tax=Cucumis melo var. makuwa TaxID=1194695 RepID=A0A5D3BQG3_CUCMM|nr:retrotransposon gag protein [Cucumis melo var. makuwa]
MMKLTNTSQRKGEPIIDYINRWRALSLDCKDLITELFAVEMCTQDMLEQLLDNQLIQLPGYKRPKQAGKVHDPNYCKYHWVISHPVEKYFVLKELILKLAREKKIKLDIDEVAKTNHVAVAMTSSVSPSTSTQFYDKWKILIQFGTFEPIVVQFQQRIVTIDSNKKIHVNDDGEGWMVVTFQKGRQPNSIRKESSFHKKHAKGSISHKKKEKRNKKMWKSKPIKEKNEDFFRP